ncbi:AmmeMemoRadiSam system radical SAM enzyme [Vibrio sp. JC009]|uniref:AmmeMemoRadiSam system radical SAM enzyme n=1 Tax=Vibrio sp. JC009 TaxID=2912314 RepID=UPI0023B025FB|nr:AmmeMemoRadiSam system radical SAM enzyme [Vibrio sp. JC009]WED20678.1 AmmeMemoRadiSam system radical SAM enzyme [Vibrio sp. JC009]
MSGTCNRRGQSRIKTKFWHRNENGLVVCDLCPRFCTLRDGKKGACFVREACDGEIVFTSYGRSSGFCIDPIEKKPLNHFYPGSSVLSFGTAGCNLGCKFCQNWNISKSRETSLLSADASPESIARLAQERNCTSVAYTYNDPVIFLEYAADTASACRELGIKNVAVTAAYINPEPANVFFRDMDAANVDLKAFTEKFYRRLCSGHLAPVLDCLLYLKHETDIWLEITTLLIPGENDSNEELEALCCWVSDNLGPDVPIHFSAFHPDFKMLTTPRTPESTLLRAREIAISNGLRYAYVGNVHNVDADSTYCPGCGKRLIKRDWYQLSSNEITLEGKCGYCGFDIAGRFSKLDTPPA